LRKAGPRPARRASARPKDAISMLRADHTRVQEMFERFESVRDPSRKEKLVQQICSELKLHARLEEEIFYPAVREAIRADDLMDEATVEHQSAKDLIRQLETMSAGDALYDAKVTVLGEYIKHHVKEEQNEMFPKVRASRLDLKELGERMRAQKDGAGERSAIGKLKNLLY